MTDTDQKPSSDENGPEIAFRNVTKTYTSGPRDIYALDDVTATVPAGSFSIFHGPSGSGKSTLLHLLGALDHCTSGSIEVGNRNLTELSESERTRFRRHDVGFIFQSLNLLSNLTALENVLVPFIPEGSSHKMRGKAKNLLDDVGLGQRLDHRPGQLSGGEKQRVAIARALLKNPSIVLADEPTGELDRDTGRIIFDLLRGIQTDHRATVVVVTHDTEYIEADDVTVELEDGHLVS